MFKNLKNIHAVADTVSTDDSMATPMFKRHAIRLHHTVALPLDPLTPGDGPDLGQGRDLRPDEGHGAGQPAHIPVLHRCLRKVCLMFNFSVSSVNFGWLGNHDAVG